MEINRILDRFDRLMKEDAFEEAEKHLLYWLKEAEELGDKRAVFTILNEMTGFYRLRRKKVEAFSVCENLLDTVEELKLGDYDTSRATAYLNTATVYNSFGLSGTAVELYSKALAIYLKNLDENDDRLAALYNNMALAIMNKAVIELRNNSIINDLEEAESYFIKALEILETKTGSENEQAITYLNMADLEEKKSGPEAGEEKILQYVEMASKLLDKSYEDHDLGFKETAEKCYGVFKKYGYFAYANDLALKIKEIKNSKVE